MKLNIKGLLFILTFYLFSFSGPLWAEEEEIEFEINSRSFKSLFNKHRYGQPKNIPWPSSYWTFEYDGMAQPDWDRKTDQFIPGTSPAEKWDNFVRLRKADDKTAQNIFKDKEQIAPKDWGPFVENIIKNKNIKSLYPATNFERERHSCRVVKQNDPNQFEGCKGWWGHCNAWSAAAIKRAEPRTPMTAYNPNNKKTMIFNVRDQKAFLTAIFMEHNIFVEGYNVSAAVKTNDWVLDPKSETAKESDDDGVSHYDKFWDPSPETFFLIFTNFMGAKKEGLAIDRFTGDEVWNQPIAGYRILPIRDKDIHPVEKHKTTAQKIYPVTLRMKIFWADDKIEENDVGLKFDIVTQTKDVEEVEDVWKGKSNYHWGKEQEVTHYDGRFLKFKLFFSKPLEMKNPTTVKSSGQIIGGIWDHQENAQDYVYDDEEGAEKYAGLNHTHPDFIWSPRSYQQEFDWPQERNPYIHPPQIDRLFSSKKHSIPKNYSKTLKYKATFAINNLEPFGLNNNGISLNYQDEFYIKYGLENQMSDRNLTFKIFQINGVNESQINVDLLFSVQSTRNMPRGCLKSCKKRSRRKKDKRKCPRKCTIKSIENKFNSNTELEVKYIN